MTYLAICSAAFAASLLTLFSGFGLGTLLMPVFAFVFPLPLAVALTAIVHLGNNLFKLAVLGQNANRRVVVRFGFPAVLTAFLGAHLLSLLTDVPPLMTYELGNRSLTILPANVVIGGIIIAFAVLEALPSFGNLKFGERWLPVGGCLSGLLGGISGHQGALRSAFLIRAGLDKEEYIATGVVIACLVDLTRILVYSRYLKTAELQTNLAILVAATASAFMGVLLGRRLLQKITIRMVQLVVSVMLVVVGIGLVVGLV